MTPTCLVARTGPCDAEVQPPKRTSTPSYAGKHSARPSQVSPVRCTERYASTPTIRNARSLWFPFHPTGAMGCGSVASTRSRSSSEAPEPGPPRLCAGRNRRRRRSATPGMARGESYVSVDCQPRAAPYVTRFLPRHPTRFGTVAVRYADALRSTFRVAALRRLARSRAHFR